MQGIGQFSKQAQREKVDRRLWSARVYRLYFYTSSCHTDNIKEALFSTGQNGHSTLLKPDLEVFDALCLKGFRERFKGLLGSGPRHLKKHKLKAVIFPFCKSVHSFGMREDFHLAFFDKNGLCLASYKDVKPNKVIYCANSSWCLESYSKDASFWPEQGARLVCEPLAFDLCQAIGLRYLAMRGV